MSDLQHSPVSSNGHLEHTTTLDPQVDAAGPPDVIEVEGVSQLMNQDVISREQPQASPAELVAGTGSLQEMFSRLTEGYLTSFKALPLPQKQKVAMIVAGCSMALLLGVSIFEWATQGQMNLVLLLGVFLLFANVSLAWVLVQSVAQPFEKLRQQTIQEDQRKQALTAIAQTRDARDLPGLLKDYLEDIRADLGADRVVVYRFNPDKSGYIAGESVLPNWVEALNDQIEDACIPQSLIDAYRKGRIVPTENVLDAGFHPDHLDLMHRLQIKSNLVTPIVQAEELYGLLVAHHCADFHAWLPAEIEYLKVRSIELGSAMGGLGLVELKEEEAKLERQQAEQKALLANISQVRQASALTPLLNQYLADIRADLGADRVVVYRFNPDKSGYIAGESVLPNWVEALNDQIEDACIPQPLIDAYRKGRIVPTENVLDAGFHPDHLDLMHRLQIKSNLVTPIAQAEELYGLLVAHHCADFHAWQAEEIEYLKARSLELGAAMGGLGLVELKEAEAKRDREQAKRKALLTDIAQVREAASLTPLLNQFLQEIRERMVADRVVVYRFHPNKSGYIAGEAVLSGWVEALNDQIEDACIPTALLEQYCKGRVVPTENVLDAGFHPDHLKLMQRLQIKSNLVTPITQAEELYGLLVAHHCADFHEWTTEEIHYLQAEARELGLAMGGLGLVEQKQAEADRERQKSEAMQRDLLQLLMSVEGASSGDLTVRAQMTAGEIGIVADFFNSILENVGEIVSQVKESSAQVNESVETNESIIGTLAETSQVQAVQITETLSSVEQMTLSIQDVASNARKASGVAEFASQTAVYGGETIDKTVTSIVQLRETVAETAKKVKRLGESSQQISKAVSLINQIALQTNLLAINASIEAARAGEEGRGFAVVAEEVGALATRSATATKEIEQIVDAIQRETGEVVDAMEKGTTQVVEGTRQVQEAKTSLTEIVDVSRKIDELLKSISDATVSQAETSAEVKQLMESITQTSEETSQTSRQVSSALKDAVGVARELQASVGAFKVSE